MITIGCFLCIGYPLLQTLVCEAEGQYHGSTILTVEYILLILLLQYFVFNKIMNITRSYIVIQCFKGHILLFNVLKVTTPLNSHKVGIMILYSILLSGSRNAEFHLFGFAKFKFSLSSGIFIATSDNSLPRIYVLINS